MSSPSDLLLSGAELVSGPEVGNPNKTIRIISQHIPRGPRSYFYHCDRQRCHSDATAHHNTEKVSNFNFFYRAKIHLFKNFQTTN